MDKAKFLRELRGEHTLFTWKELTGIDHQTQNMWENGEREPSAESVNRLADALDWDDKQRMRLMPTPRGEGLSARFERRLQYLRLTVQEAALILGRSSSTIRNWRSQKMSNAAEKLVREFLKMSKDEVYELLEEKQPMTDEPERKKIPYELIYKLENKYGQMAKAKNNDPILKELQEAMK